MSRDMDSTIRTQFELYGRITRSYENLRKSGSANITVGLVEARLQALEANWAKFEHNHDKLTTSWEALRETDYAKKDMLTLTEEAYLTQKGMLSEALYRLKCERNEASAASTPLSQPPQTTLPRIQLPQFSGLYEDWPSFRDLFHSLIGKDVSASNVEKLHYLKACLKGEAELLIRSLPTTGENFDRAWRALTDYYENKRLLVRSYIARFLALQRVKGESSTDLRALYHGVLNTVGSLESIGRPITSGEDLFVHLVVDLMDSQSRREWENAISDTTHPPAYKELIQFLDRRLHTVESLQPSKPEPSTARPGATSGRSPRVHNVRKSDGNRGQCSLCHKEHYIMFCDAYKAKPAAERRQHVEKHQLCFNCLGKHKVSDCSSKKTCSICDARHHSTLHDACKTTEVAKSSLSANRASKATLAVLLATARVRVADKFGVFHTARALIDQGSEVSIVAESLVQRLQLSRTPASTDIVGVGGQLTGSRGRVELALTPLRDGPPLRVSALILRQLTLYTGGIRVSRNTWPHINGIELADPDFFADDSVELLLGADVCATILQPGLRRGGRRQPVAQRTTLGWILSGSVGTSATTRSAQTHHCCSDGDLHDLVQEFWRQEEVVAKAIPPTTEEQEAEDHFVQTHTRDTSGRFVVRLPLRLPLPDLAGTKRTAARLLGQMEHKFARDEQLKQRYTDFMREYEVLGHMSLVQPAGAARPADCYLPHHGVMRKGNSAKIRVVFNGSSTVPSGASLNRHLKVGPNLLPALEDILLRWRVHRFVLASDIEKMYRQILVAPEDRHLQRILWRYEDQTAPQTYQLNTVTYGLACAPFLALRSLRQLADDEEVHFPHGSAALRQDVYMDDILTGAPSIEEAMDLQRQLTELCTAGGFPLRKWSIKVPIYTKRSVLSLTARLFDPLGWLAPTIIRAKIWFQSTWLQGVDWDTPLDEANAQQWSTLQEDLPRLEEIRVPRRVPIDHADARIELHGFADASERAYAAVVYARTETRHGETTIILLSAKTRVAPLRTVSLPRLELCAASLLARLVVHLRQTLGTGGAPIHLWSDSTVALGWIRGHPSRWKVYVANRVAEIQAALPGAHWHHLPGTENPADCASRGISPSELVAHPLWWRGPLWLSEGPTSWPSSREEELIGDLPRLRVTPARPFWRTGVDYAGLIQLRTTKGRGHRWYKAFVAVFVCLSTKAVHLEVVSDYSAEAFLAALRRFTARRGLCRSLHSDCGTNFVGADAQLRAFFAASNPAQRQIADQLATDRIHWDFNPPSAPHFGGLWEAAVKSLKHHLRRVLGESTLTYEEMSTLLTQIEACMNSRPLQALTDDPDDVAALTPGHFLVGAALNAVPEPNLLDAPIGRLSRWQLVQRMRDHFWSRWSQEYLHSLSQRPKWWIPNSEIRVGRLCLIRSDNTPPTRWPLARIINVHPGDDGRVRVVTIRTATSELTRPIVKIVLLPESRSDEQEDNPAPHGRNASLG
ncbi:uncharacterized protein LOC126857789 [Cataglyphis hispanica]|uniref:uncharacterized protein LOC126857789 n=1 Tax=Cataglyphis hispanica TaxID=1086592 RepID=UPI00218008FA|nr:uncharacterized protein LOC126857789 [Cataglyphis hispanica]